MARRYSVDGRDTNTASTTILGLTSAATIRPRIYDIVIGSAATPADNAGEYYFQRYTAAGTATAVTPQALDNGDPASLAASGEAHTVEPTYTANAVLLAMSSNQRASIRWMATPGGELVLPATAANGVGCLVAQIAGSAIQMSVCLHFVE